MSQKKWVTMSQACLIFGASRRTLTRWVKDGKVESKLENNRRYILVDEVGHVETEGQDDSDMSQDMSQQELVEQLRSENEYLRESLSKTQADLEVAKERSDTIVLQLTRQLEQSQRLLEHHQEPWYRRWFRKKRPEGG